MAPRHLVAAASALAKDQGANTGSAKALHQPGTNAMSALQEVWRREVRRDSRGAAKHGQFNTNRKEGQGTMPDAAGQSQAFQADVAKLLHLMVHSVYSDRDIFLRELLSNAADACEQLRCEALADPALASSPFAIRISIDKDAQTLAIGDNGIGMSRRDLNAPLGTIPRSSTRA